MQGIDAPTSDAMEEAQALFTEIVSSEEGYDNGPQTIATAITTAEARARQAERERARPVIEAAQALYDAHRRTNSEYGAPAKFGMNYGKLNALRATLEAFRKSINE